MKKVMGLGSWEELYSSKDAESMPWFYDKLDPDLEKALVDLGIKEGRFLDVGTGPGTQAIALAKMGFHVTGTDISETAIEKVK